jgi:dCTP diphosphatase
MSDLDEIRDAMRAFTAERGWERFHDPKSLLLALVGEVGELTELFQWLPSEDAVRLAGEEPLRTRAGEEIADVFLYLVQLADVLDVDLREVTERKLLLNAAKHVVPDVESSVAPVGRIRPAG